MKQGLFLPLMVSLIIVSSATAMEKDRGGVNANPSIPINNMCYFNVLPPEVLDYLAQIVMCDDETTEEFIERTRRGKEVPGYYHSFFASPRTDIFIDIPVIPSSEGSHYTLSPRENKVATLELFPTPELTILDLKNNEDTIIYKGKLEVQLCRGIALSPSGNMFATISTGKNFITNESNSSPVGVIIELHNVLTQKKRVLYSSHEVNSFQEIAFNKQGTCCIVHGTQERSHKDSYMIFSLKMSNVTQPPENVKDTPTLELYFREKRVVNKLLHAAHKVST